MLVSLTYGRIVIENEVVQIELYHSYTPLYTPTFTHCAVQIGTLFPPIQTQWAYSIDCTVAMAIVKIVCKIIIFIL